MLLFLTFCIVSFVPADQIFEDLFQFDPHSFIWTQLENSIQGAPSPPLYAMGFASIENRLYLYGGAMSTGSKTKIGEAT